MAHKMLLSIFVLAAFADQGIRLCYSQISPTTAVVNDITTLPSLVREVEDNSRYKTLEANATLLKLLVDDKTGVSKTEVFDMLHSRDENDQHVDLPTFPEDAQESRAEVIMTPDSPDAQAELLQAPDELVHKDSPRPRQRQRNASESVGLAAAIMVAVTVSIVVIAYTALIVWRRIYLKRNGLKHELLRNEDIAETRIEL